MNKAKNIFLSFLFLISLFMLSNCSAEPVTISLRCDSLELSKTINVKSTVTLADFLKTIRDLNKYLNPPEYTFLPGLLQKYNPKKFDVRLLNEVNKSLNPSEILLSSIDNLSLSINRLRVFRADENEGHFSKIKISQQTKQALLRKSMEYLTRLYSTPIL